MTEQKQPKHCPNDGAPLSTRKRYNEHVFSTYDFDVVSTMYYREIVIYGCPRCEHTEQEKGPKTELFY